MVRKPVAMTLAGLIGFAALAGGFTSAARASDVKNWYVYCEGKVNGKSSAIFSTNIWPHAETNAYQSALAAAAERYIAGSPGTKLSGCAGIPFHDQTIAAYNRDKTAKMVRRVGDTVYYVDLPERALPD